MERTKRSAGRCPPITEIFSLRASPVASPKASPKGIWGAPDKKSVPAASLKAHFCPARPDTVSGAPSPSPSHRGRSGDAGHNEKRGGLPHVGDYLHKPLVRASFLVAPSFPRLPPHRRRWISRPFGRLISAESRHRCRGSGSRRSCRRRVASASQNAPSNPPHLRAQKVLDDLPAMDSDDEMVALLLEDEQAFDDDLREHLLIIASLQDMLDAEAEKRKRPPIVGANRSECFLHFVERILQRIKGWKEKMLPIGGKEVLIKAVIQSIPVYFLLPKNVCKKITDIIAQYWWGDDEKGKKMHWYGG
nr:uncharacterized protein LOC127347262 [Lolium perenne]